MRFEKNIYQVNWRVLVLQLLPTRLRQPKLTTLAIALTSPIAVIYTLFTNIKRWAEYELTITPQVCYLEKILNDQFDYQYRRIRIREPQYDSPLTLYTKAEQQPLALYNTATGKRIVLFTKKETIMSGVDFVLVLPKDFALKKQKLHFLIKKYFLPTKTYTILYE